MSQNQNNFFDQVEKKTNVKQQDLFKLAQSVEGANLKDEQTVRKLIHDVASLAGVKVSKQKEEELVKAIVNNQMPMDFASLSKLFNSK